jgi:acetoacetate decarboxylase
MYSGSTLDYRSRHYSSPPFTYRGSQSLVITVSTDPEAIKPLVPPPLKPFPEGVMSVIVGVQKLVAPLEMTYGEAALSIPVKLEEEEGDYVPVLYLDNVTPILAGREIYGYPKVDAEVKLVVEDGRARGEVCRGGEKIVEMELQLGPAKASAPPMPARSIFNVKYIPAVDRKDEADVRRLIRIQSGELQVTRFCPAEGIVKLRSIPTDPLGNFPVLNVLNAFFIEVDQTLGFGTVAHDYLKEK